MNIRKPYMLGIKRKHPTTGVETYCEVSVVDHHIDYSSKVLYLSVGEALQYIPLETVKWISTGEPLHE